MSTLQRIRIYYDSLGRVVRTRNSDGTEQRVIYGIPTALSTPNDYAPTPWENYSYDANDLAPLANPGTNPVPSTQWYTPKSAEVDALGRTIKTTEHQAQDTGSGYEDVNMFYSYDIRGNLLLVKDPYHRHVFEHKYDLRPAQKDEQGNAQPLPPIWTNHIDKGQSNLLFDALAKPIESHDAKDAMTLSSYDVISRPENAWAKNDSSDTLRLRQYLIYGDSAGLTNPQNQNLKGKLYQNYDEAGLNEISEYDFKGNVLNKKRQVVDSATLKTDLDNYNSFLIDWTGLPAILDTFVFESDMEYDALNRVTKLTLPEDVSATRKEIIPTYNRAGALEQVSYDGTDYVKNIAYNAKGQRILIAFGNNVMTRYAYDNLSFRLLRQRSEKYTFSQSGSTVTYAYNSGTNKQDDGFNYDLVGNILKILNRVTDCGISGSALGSNALDREFEYDPLYRLTYADGRESDTQNQNTYLYDDAPAPGSPNANHVRAYSRTYSYDKLGNVQSVVQGGTNGFTRDFVYNTGQNTLQEINDSTPTLIEDFTYDNCGNQITAGSTRNYKWNHADLLYCYYNQASPADPTVFTQYDYDAAGKRLSKLVRTGTLGSPIYERTIYIDGIFEYVKLENGTTYEKNYVHVMDDQSRICEVRVNVGPAFPGDITDDVTYHLEDQIGSSVVRLSTTATVIDKEEYYPFGDSSLRTFTYKRYRYVGKERDQESGLYYYGARYYAAWTCRFISVDPLAKDYMYLTPYNYAGNRPIISVDIDGMQGDKNAKDSNRNNNTTTTNGNDGANNTGQQNGNNQPPPCDDCEGGKKQQEALKQFPNYKSDGKGGIKLNDTPTPKTNGTPTGKKEEPAPAPDPRELPGHANAGKKREGAKSDWENADPKSKTDQGFNGRFYWWSKIDGNQVIVKFQEKDGEPAYYTFEKINRIKIEKKEELTGGDDCSKFKKSVEYTDTSRAILMNLSKAIRQIIKDLTTLNLKVCYIEIKSFNLDNMLKDFISKIRTYFKKNYNLETIINEPTDNSWGGYGSHIEIFLWYNKK